MNIKDSLIKARIVLLTDRCFYGILALSLALESSDRVPTFATDGKKIFYNEDFVRKIDNGILKNTKEKQFIICHEILHCMFLHFARRGSRDLDKWNIATDYAINIILYDEFGFS